MDIWVVSNLWLLENNTSVNLVHMSSYMYVNIAVRGRVENGRVGWEVRVCVILLLFLRVYISLLLSTDFHFTTHGCRTNMVKTTDWKNTGGNQWKV